MNIKLIEITGHIQSGKTYTLECLSIGYIMRDKKVAVIAPYAMCLDTIKRTRYQDVNSDIKFLTYERAVKNKSAALIGIDLIICEDVARFPSGLDSVDRIGYELKQSLYDSFVTIAYAA